MIRDIISLSEAGLRRENNQDAVLAVTTGRTGVFAVADGMGGHYRGELASQTAVLLLKSWWEGISGCIASMPFGTIVADLEKKVQEINQTIFQTYEEMEQRGGTTLCLLLIQKDSYAVINVGDSRLYRCKGLSCMQITTDDIWENQAHNRGADIQNSPHAGKLVQALGAQKELAVHIITGAIQKRTYFFLCTDGIYKYCGNPYLFMQLKTLLWKKDAKAAVKQIKKRVYKNGAEDNLSMVLVLAEAGERG